jgi:hypothetical protein
MPSVWRYDVRFRAPDIVLDKPLGFFGHDGPDNRNGWIIMIR